MMSKYVAIKIEGEVTVHLPHWNGNGATMCGLDGDDPHRAVQQAWVDVPKGAKVNCLLCWSMLQKCRQFSVRDFDSSVKE